MQVKLVVDAAIVVDLVFLVDESDSVNLHWDIVLSFIEDIVSALDIGDTAARVGFIKFGDRADNVFDLDAYSDREDLLEAIADVSYDGGSETNTQEALAEMHTDQFKDDRGDRADAANVVILLADGESSIDPENTIPEAEEARRKGIDILTIGIGPDANAAELRLMSSEPHHLDENYFMLSSFGALSSIADTIRARITEIAEGRPNFKRGDGHIFV